MNRTVAKNTVQPNNLRHVAFCGGGSGGHLFPAIAVTQQLLQRQADCKVTFVTSSRDIDSRILNGANLPDSAVSRVVQPIASSAGRLTMIWATTKSLFLCRRQFRKSRPSVVVGTGGFASIAGVLAAAWLKIPVVLLECNAIPGRANRMLSRFATATATGWPIGRKHMRGWKCEIHETGIPVRKSFRPTAGTVDGQRRVLVLGGSQGATRLNDIVLDAFAQRGDGCTLQVNHQTGGVHLSAVRKRYQQIHKDSAVDVVGVDSFIEDVAEAIMHADIVISRAGAVTIAEIAAIGRPVILIPLSTAADDHQTANANCLCTAAAAVQIDEQSSDASTCLNKHLDDLLDSQNRRQEMARACAEAFRLTATSRLIELLNDSIQQTSAISRQVRQT